MLNARHTNNSMLVLALKPKDAQSPTDFYFFIQINLSVLLQKCRKVPDFLWGGGEKFSGKHASVPLKCTLSRLLWLQVSATYCKSRFAVLMESRD